MEDDFLKNFGMIIPKEAVSMELKPDPNGVPIYAKCPSTSWCACTGACREILGYDTDPDKVKSYHEDIERRNKLLKEHMASFTGTLTNVSGDGKIQIWSREWPKTNK